MTTLDAHPLAHLTDAAALRIYARRGDPRAFELLAERYRGMVLATCRRALGNDADAEDAAQETFLRLARSAAQIRSNAAAWLHAAAVRASIDLQRRAGAQARAERRAADPSAAPAGSAAPAAEVAAWRELEPMLDAALEALDPADRELIVARFLAGRPQTELAREAGISPGSMHRRIDRALERLRTKLIAAGVTAGVGATGGLAAAISHAAAPASPALAGATGKIALAGMTHSAAAAGVLSAPKLVPVAAVLALAGGLLVGTAVLLPRSRTNAPSPGPVVAGIAVARAEAPARPKRTSKPYAVASSLHADFRAGGLIVERRELRIHIDYDAAADKAYTLRFRIDEVDTSGPMPVLTLTMLSGEFPASSTNHIEVGQQMRVGVEVDDEGQIALHPAMDDSPPKPSDMSWYGLRPPLGWREHAQIPADAGPLGILGPWAERSRLSAEVSPDFIRLFQGDWTGQSYRILDWQAEGEHARVRTICTASLDQADVGKRFAMLVRTDEKGLSLAYHPLSTKRNDEFPSSFEFTAENPVRVIVLREEP